VYNTRAYNTNYATDKLSASCQCCVFYFVANVSFIGAAQNCVLFAIKEGVDTISL